MLVTLLTPAVKSTVARGSEYAARDHVGEIRPDHLFAAVLEDADGRRLLGGQALTEDALRQVFGDLETSRRKGGLSAAEESALAGLGIDLDTVVGQIEDRLGTQALAGGQQLRPRWWHKPVLSQESVRILAEAERHLSAAGGRSLGVEHLCLALVSAPSALAESLARRGVSETSVRAAMSQRAGSGSR